MNPGDAEARSGQEVEAASSVSPRLHGLNQWLLWQLADSAFPTGGFAHSGGLEAAWQHGELRSGTDLAEYLRAALNQLPHSAMPFAYAAFSETQEFAEIDSSCDAFLSNHVANRGSRLQGQALLASAERTFAVPALTHFRETLLEANAPGHLAPVFGAVMQLLEVDSPAAARLFVFTHVRGWTSAAVRLNVIGPMEAQRVQHQLADVAEEVASKWGAVPLDQVAQTAPLLDLWQGTQDRLYSRLFQT